MDLLWNCTIFKLKILIIYTLKKGQKLDKDQI